MGVEVLGTAQEIDGHGDSMEVFRTANNANANMLLNVSEGKKKNAPRPAYDPRHPDNQWPKAVYHPASGMLTVGKSLLGVKDLDIRKKITQENEKAHAEALKAGHRSEPYVKPQIAVLDPAIEKAEALRRETEMRGQITALTDMVAKLMATKS